MAAPPMNPTTAAWERKSIKNPNLRAVRKKKMRTFLDHQQKKKKEVRLPEESEGCFSDTGEKRGGEGKAEIFIRICVWVDLSSKKSA